MEKKPSAKKAAKKKKSKSNKKPRRRKAVARGKARKGAALARAAVRAAIALADDPIGACSWTDASGQNHCKITTQSLCKNIPGSTFDAGKQCI